jgi:hypothetical protein
MDFRQTMLVIVRRWYVAVPAFLVALGIAGLSAYTQPRLYEATGTVVLSEPNPVAAHTDGSIQGNGVGNPLMSFADSLRTSSALLVQNLNSPDAQQQVRRQGGVTTFTASDGSLTGPFIVVKADGRTPDRLTRTVSLAFTYATDQLRQREQALGAPPSQYIVVQTVVAPTDAAQLHGGRTRFAATTVILSLVACLCAVYAAETISRRAARRAVA